MQTLVHFSGESKDEHCKREPKGSQIRYLPRNVY
ncbi:hypothetical protein [Caudoviricetes sp.]|nr:hypothetical protein [Caudoviricetes sp.]